MAMVWCALGALSLMHGAFAQGLPIDEPFDGNQLHANWHLMNQATVQLTQANGELQAPVITNAVWYQADATGFFAFQSVTGSDLMLTARVKARQQSNPSLAINDTYHFAGPMLRDPASDSGAQNYVFTAVGYRSAGSGNKIEYKQTTDSSSQVSEKPWTGGDAELRVCRVGDMVYTLSRPLSGGAWQVDGEYSRPGMPLTLQAGFMAFSYANLNFLPIFDHFSAEAISSLSDCTGQPVSSSTGGGFSSTGASSTGDSSSSTGASSSTGEASPAVVVVDNADAGATIESGTWASASGASNPYQSNSMFATVGGAVDIFRFTPELSVAGRWAVDVWNSCYTPRSTTVTHRIVSQTSTLLDTLVDQDSGTGLCAQWETLGSYDLPAGSITFVEISDEASSAGQYIGADAVRFTLLSDDSSSSSSSAGASSSSSSSSTGASSSSSSSSTGASSSGSTGSETSTSSSSSSTAMASPSPSSTGSSIASSVSQAVVSFPVVVLLCAQALFHLV